MYVQRVMLSPSRGKANQLRSALEERVRARQAAGVRTGLSQIIFGADQPFVIVIAADNLAGLQAIRDRGRDDPDFQALITRVDGLIDRSPDISLIETLSAPQDPPATPDRFAQRVLFTPALGKANELRGALEQRVALRRSERIQCNLSQVVFGAETGLALRLLFSDLAGLEALRARNLTDPGFQQFQARIASLTTGPVTVDLSEILIPMQPVATREMAAAATR